MHKALPNLIMIVGDGKSFKYNMEKDVKKLNLHKVQTSHEHAYEPNIFGMNIGMMNMDKYINA